MIGKKVYLRPLELNDVQTLYVFENDVEVWAVSDTVMPYSSFALEQYVMEATRTDIYGSKQLRLVICDCANGKAVGFIDLFNFSPRDFRAEVGVLIERNSRHKGFASEALSLLVDYAFKTLHVHQLSCTLTAENTISRRLFEKAGFVHTSTRKDWFFRNNKWEDELVYQLLK